MRAGARGAGAADDQSRGDRRDARAAAAAGRQRRQGLDEERAGGGVPVSQESVRDEGHDYGPSKRKAAYAFFIKHGVLHGTPNEQITKDSDEALSVFNEKTPMPATALKTPEAIEAALGRLHDAPAAR